MGQALPQGRDRHHPNPYTTPSLAAATRSLGRRTDRLLACLDHGQITQGVTRRPCGPTDLQDEWQEFLWLGEASQRRLDPASSTPEGYGLVT